MGNANGVGFGEVLTRTDKLASPAERSKLGVEIKPSPTCETDHRDFWRFTPSRSRSLRNTRERLFRAFHREL